MDIRGLKYFISAAECLNFTRAAKECFITQTAMSQHIANMAFSFSGATTAMWS